MLNQTNSAPGAGAASEDVSTSDRASAEAGRARDLRIASLVYRIRSIDAVAIRDKLGGLVPIETVIARMHDVPDYMLDWLEDGITRAEAKAS